MKDETKSDDVDSPDSARPEFLSLDCEVKAAEDDAAESRVYRFIGTTATRDRQGDEIPLKGWDFKSYRKNPVVLWAHDYGTPPIGKVTKITSESVKDKDAIVFDVKFAETPFAEEIRSLVHGGFLSATSVGFRSLKSQWIEEDEETREERRKQEPDAMPGREFLKKELLELSIVPVPANAEALRVKAMDGGELRAWLDDHDVETPADEVCSNDNTMQKTETASDNEPDVVDAAEDVFNMAEFKRALAESRDAIIGAMQKNAAVHADISSAIGDSDASQPDAEIANTTTEEVEASKASDDVAQPVAAIADGMSGAERLEHIPRRVRRFRIVRSPYSNKEGKECPNQKSQTKTSRKTLRLTRPKR